VPSTEANDIKKLRKLIKDIEVAMLTTVAPDGTLRSRPMASPDYRFEGELWFFTRAGATPADDVRDNQRVNVSFAEPRDGRYVSIAGTAAVVRDTGRVRELWSPRFKEWFPLGKKDPALALLRIGVDQAEYWDGSSGQMQRLGAVAAQAAAPPAVEHRRVDLTDMPEPKGGAQG
jgi:general stress protein 26